MDKFTNFLEQKLMPIATKFSTQRHLKAVSYTHLTLPTKA